MEETEDMLTAQEVDALFTAIHTSIGALGSDSGVYEAISGAIPGEDDPVNPDDLVSGFPVDTTYACSGGGSMNLQGRVMLGTSDSGGLVSNYDFSFVPSGCVVTVENTTFTLGSQSDMRQQGMISTEVLEGDNALTIAIPIKNTGTGKVDWELDDRSGMCDMDLSTDVRVGITIGSDPDADILLGLDVDVEGGTTGTLCDIEVNRPAEVPENPEDLLAGPASQPEDQ